MKYEVFDINFQASPKEEIFNEISNLLNKQTASSVLFVNAHVVVEATRDSDLMKLLKSATIVVPDGVPITWVMKLKGQKDCQRYSGPDLMADVIENLTGTRHFFLGSTPEVLKKIEERMVGKDAAFYSPPFSKSGFSEVELNRQLDIIGKFDPDFIWVGLGAPKQERYAVEMAKRSKKGVWLAVGAAFDFYSGLKPRAPLFIQKYGLEWAFRFVTEPKRLGLRYLSTNPAFIKLALGELIRR